MLRQKRRSCSVPFPRIPESLKAKYSISELYLRPFGFFESDLDVNFNEKLRPYPANKVLQYCTVDKNGKTPDQAFFWDLPVGKRIECLLFIAISGGSSDMPVYLRCLNQACRQQMEIDVSLQDLADLHHQTDDMDCLTIEVGAGTLQVRKPTGRDQLDWLGSSFPDEDAAIEAIIRTLVSNNGKALVNQEGLLPDEWIQTISSAIEEFDPLINFNFLVHCPYCEKENRYEIDLEGFILGKLHRSQQALLEVVHRLAKHYHWSEKQILSIPSWRRSQYLALIEKEGQ